MQEFVLWRNWCRYNSALCSFPSGDPCASFPDWESCPLHVLHPREGAVWGYSLEASGAATPLVQHGDDAGSARDPGEHQRGDQTAGGFGPVATNDCLF